MIFMHRLIIFIIVIFTGFEGLSQDLSFEQFTEADGLPSMKIYNIVEDKNGVLWMGTENGLVSYDGEEFIRHTHPDLIDNDIIRIEMTPDGRIYFLNLSSQISYIEDYNIHRIEIPSHVNSISNICIREGKIYTILGVPSLPKLIHELIENPDNTFNLKQTNYYFFHDNGKDIYGYIQKDELYPAINSDTVLRRINLGREYKSQYGKSYIGKYPSRGHNAILYPTDFSFIEYCIKIDYRNIIKVQSDYYVAGRKGVHFYNSSTNQFFPFLQEMRINSVFIDSEQNGWITTAYNGLLKIPNLRRTLINQNILDGNLGIHDIVQTKNGNILLGTTTGEIFIHPLSENKTLKDFKDIRPVSFLFHHDDIIAYNDGSLALIDKNNHVKETHTLTGAVKKIHIYRDKTFFSLRVGAYFSNEVVIKNIGTFENFRPELKDYGISDFCTNSSSDTLFIGTNKGLLFYTRDTIEIVSNEEVQKLNISCITLGKNNSLWIGTVGNGVYEFRNDSIINRFTTDNVLISDYINNIEFVDGELFISTNEGLVIFNRDTGSKWVLNTYNFLPTNNVLICKKINNQYWIGTIKGLTILTREEIANSISVGPKLSLKNILVNGNIQNYNQDLSLKYNENNIQLNFRNISHKSGNDIFLNYRIPLIDTSWIKTSEKTIRLPSLKQGKYLIEAYGVNAIGTKGNLVKLNFTIKPPWWSTLWARIVGFLLLLSATYGIILYRGRRIRKEEQVKRDYLSQINKIKDQALQLQMNPHFIFNSLNAIQGFIGTDDEEQAMNYLARFARLIRLIFEHSKGNTISLEEELEFIKLYLDLEQLRFGNKVEIELKVDDDLDAIKDTIRIPPLLIQPIVENSFKHGLFHKKGQGILKIEFLLKEESIFIVVEDNGIGREAAQKIGSKNKEKRVSSGISTTKERIDLLNFGLKEKANKISIVDLEDKDGKAKGTRTTLVLTVDQS